MIKFKVGTATCGNAAGAQKTLLKFKELAGNEKNMKIKIDETDMLSKLEVLKKTAENNDSEKTVELLAELVPTFCHKVND